MIGGSSRGDGDDERLQRQSRPATAAGTKPSSSAGDGKLDEQRCRHSQAKRLVAATQRLQPQQQAASGGGGGAAAATTACSVPPGMAAVRRSHRLCRLAGAITATVSRFGAQRERT